jgi:probable HAF family extracellular repeat protein
MFTLTSPVTRLLALATLCALPILAAPFYAIQDIGPYPSDATRALAQASALALGRSFQDLIAHPLVWPTIGTLGGPTSYQAGINVYGQTTGYSATVNGRTHAFYWNGVNLRDIGTLGGLHSWGFAINDNNFITGGAITPSGEQHAFIWYGTMQDLGTLGGDDSFGMAINDVGQVTGAAVNANNQQHAFFWNGANMQDLGTLGGIFSAGRAINTYGDIVGMSTIDLVSSMRHAFLWTRNSMTDLNSVIPTGTGWLLTTGLAINDAGQIGGYGILNGEQHGFVLTPITPR